MQFKGLLIRSCLLHIRTCLYIAYEDRHSLWSLLFFKAIYFWRPHHFECFILEMYSKQNHWAILFYTLVLQFHLKKMGKRKKKKITFGGKTEEKQNSATIMISVDWKTTTFQWSWNYERKCLNNMLKKRILRKI